MARLHRGRLRLAFAAMLLLVLPAASCPDDIQPQTPRQSLAAAEHVYQAALESVQEVHRAGLVRSAESRERLRLAIRSARAALDSWQLNPDIDDAGAGARSALRALQAVLLEIRQGVRS